MIVGILVITVIVGAVGILVIVVAANYGCDRVSGCRRVGSAALRSRSPEAYVICGLTGLGTNINGLVHDSESI